MRQEVVGVDPTGLQYRSRGDSTYHQPHHSSATIFHWFLALGPGRDTPRNLFPIGSRKELGGETRDDLVDNTYWPMFKPIGKGTSRSRALIGWEEGKVTAPPRGAKRWSPEAVRAPALRVCGGGR